MTTKPMCCSSLEAAMIIPLLEFRLIQWEGLPLPTKYRFRESVQSLLQKLTSGGSMLELTKTEKLMICSCLNETWEDRIVTLKTTTANSPERIIAEKNIDMAKDLLEKCGYHKRNRHFEYSNNFRFHTHAYEARRYEQMFSN